MTFYTYQYLVDNQVSFPYLRWMIITILVISVVALSVRYFKNKGDIKYKDLAVIAGTLLVLFLALQFNDYSNLRTTSQQGGKQVALVKDVAKKLNIKPQKLSFNNTRAGVDNILVKSPQGYYRVLFNDDNSAYVLEKVDLAVIKVKVKGD